MQLGPWDPPLTAAELERFLPGGRRLLQKMVLEEVIRTNPLRVRAHVARQLGYCELADEYDALADAADPDA